MNEKIDDVDRISILPAFIMHHILSFLPRKDAAKTSLLSKKWNCVWSSFPILDFNQIYYLDCNGFRFPDTRSHLSHNNQKRAEKFMNIVDQSLSRFHQHKLQMQKFKLHMTLVDIKLASWVDKWIELALEHDAKEIDLMVRTEKDPWYTFPETIFVTKSTSSCKLDEPFSRSDVKLYSLQKLWLEDIYVNEEVIQAIIHICPFITYFAIIRCKGVKPLDITTCHNLKQLYLSGLSITDQYLHFNISRFPHLETLQLFICNELERIKISAQGLKMLEMEQCRKLVEVEIDAPNLSSFQYSDIRNEFPMIFSKNAPCPFELSLLSLSHRIDTLWFLKLRELLVMSNQRKVLRLTIHCQEVIFNLEELRGITLPPPFELELLKLDVNVGNSTLSFDYGSLIDGLLWSCCPKIFSLPTVLDFQKKCIKVLCEMVLGREDPDCCCSFNHKCWRHHLKGAKIVTAGIEGLLDCKTLFDTWPTLPIGQKIQFRLDWEHHLHGRVT